MHFDGDEEKQDDESTENEDNDEGTTPATEPETE